MSGRSALLAALATAALAAGASENGNGDESEMFSPDKPLGEQAERALAVTGKGPMAAPLSDGEGGVSYLFGGARATLVCAPIHVCEIALQPGETLQPGGVHLGDATRWEISPIIGAARQTILVVKPLDAGLKTNMTIHTTMRSYGIRLESHSTKFIPRISFRYPFSSSVSAIGVNDGTRPSTGDAWVQYRVDVDEQGRRDAAAAEHTAREPANENDEPVLNTRLRDLDYAYEVDACRRCGGFKPRVVYNDGKSTWIVLPTGYSGDLPVFALSDDGAGVVEQRWHSESGTLQVEMVFEKGVLAVKRRRVEITWLGSAP